MSTLGNILDQLEAQIKTTIPIATIYWARVENDDSTPMPLFEITLINKMANDLCTTTLEKSRINILYHARTANDKKTIAGFKEKLEVESTLRAIISNWEDSISKGPITDVVTDHLATFNSGEYGSLDENVISVGIEFSIEYLEH